MKDNRRPDSTIRISGDHLELVQLVRRDRGLQSKALVDRGVLLAIKELYQLPNTSGRVVDTTKIEDKYEELAGEKLK